MSHFILKFESYYKFICLVHEDNKPFTFLLFWKGFESVYIRSLTSLLLISSSLGVNNADAVGIYYRQFVPRIIIRTGKIAAY